jgi:hypothetical protein
MPPLAHLAVGNDDSCKHHPLGKSSDHILLFPNPHEQQAVCLGLGMQCCASCIFALLVYIFNTIRRLVAPPSRACVAECALMYPGEPGYACSTDRSSVTNTATYEIYGELPAVEADCALSVLVGVVIVGQNRNESQKRSPLDDYLGVEMQSMPKKHAPESSTSFEQRSRSIG